MAIRLVMNPLSYSFYRSVADAEELSADRVRGEARLATRAVAASFRAPRRGESVPEKRRAAGWSGVLRVAARPEGFGYQFFGPPLTDTTPVSRSMLWQLRQDPL